MRIASGFLSGLFTDTSAQRQTCVSVLLSRMAGAAFALIGAFHSSIPDLARRYSPMPDAFSVSFAFSGRWRALYVPSYVLGPLYFSGRLLGFPVRAGENTRSMRHQGNVCAAPCTGSMGYRLYMACGDYGAIRVASIGAAARVLNM